MTHFVRFFQPWLGSLGKALAEVGIVAFFSFVPAVLSASRMSMSAEHQDHVFIPSLLASVSNGQLVVFTAAILGTIIWQALPFWQPSKFVKVRSFLILIITILVIFVTYIGGFDPSFKGGNSLLFTTSIYTYLFALITYMVLLVINNPPETDLGASMQIESDALANNYNNTHGE